MTESFRYNMGKKVGDLSNMIDLCLSSSMDCPYKRMGNISYTGNLKSCVKDGNAFVLFLATDLKGDPKKNKHLSKLFTSYPCIYSVLDFKEEMHVDSTTGPVTSSNFDKFVPFVDSIVLSSANVFIPSLGSTFSQYAEDAHDRLLLGSYNSSKMG
jgi:hypothetical protein